MCVPRHSRCRTADGLRRRLRPRSSTVAIAVGVGLGSRQASVATSAPHLAGKRRRSAWQFPVPNWNHSNKEEGRVDDVLQIGGIAYIGGNFTQTADHSGHTVARARTSPPRASPPAR